MSTESFKNNSAFIQNAKLTQIHEYPLFTDATFISGSISTNKKFPYEILNPIVDFKQPILLPRIVLRVFDYTSIEDDIASISKRPLNEKQTSNLSTLTSLGTHQEICALLSLIYGIRLKAGSYNRSFQPKSKINKFGSLINRQVYENPPPNRVCIGNPRIPHAIRYMTKNPNVLLNDAEPFLEHLIKIKNKKDYAAIIRAARIYSDALWFAENDPNHSWIMFVSAIESAAECWNRKKYNDIELFRAEYESLYCNLEGKLDQKTIKSIAKLIHPRPKKNLWNS